MLYAQKLDMKNQEMKDQVASVDRKIGQLMPSLPEFSETGEDLREISKDTAKLKAHVNDFRQYSEMLGEASKCLPPDTLITHFSTMYDTFGTMEIRGIVIGRSQDDGKKGAEEFVSRLNASTRFKGAVLLYTDEINVSGRDSLLFSLTALLH